LHRDGIVISLKVQGGPKVSNLNLEAESGQGKLYEANTFIVPVLTGTDREMGRQPYALRFPFPPTRAARAIGESIGPIRQGLAALDAAHRSNLQAEIEALFVTENRATGGNTNIPSEYLDVRGRRK
jgi:hypothetical protein